MNTYKKPNQVEIVYFSGTGSTKKVADQFAESFRKNSINANLHPINYRSAYTLPKTDMLILVYPVYALNAPKPIYEFIKKLPQDMSSPVVVISVSGGGEVTPNNACRLHCINRLEKKGYSVVYEQMIVMPSNFLLATPDELSIRLLEVLPDKVEYIVGELQSGIIRRTKPDLLNRCLSFVGELEKTAFLGKYFGRHIKVSRRCNSCGICQKGCPTGNIKTINNKPVFGKSCVICLKCFYSCPRRALQPGIGKFVILKEGYPLKDWEKKQWEKKKYSIDELAKGYAYSGIRKYLKMR